MQTRRCTESARPLLGMCSLAIVFCAGCVELPVAAKNTLNEARTSYERGDYSAANRKLDQLIRDYPTYTQTAEAYYLRALCHTARSNMGRAGEDVKQCIAKSSDPTLTAKAHAMAGAILFDQGNADAAAGHYRKALRNLPKESQNDLVYYRYGICLQRLGRWKEAKAQFATILKQYRGSSLAEHAQRLHDWSHPYFAIQCGAFRDRDRAATLARELGRSRINATVERRITAGEPLHTVLAGRYTTYEEARRALPTIRRRVDGAMIVP